MRAPLESPLLVLGLVAIVVAYASLGVAVARERPLAFKVIGGVVGVLIGFALSILASFLAAALIPESGGWVQEEAGLWFSALLALGVTTAFAHQARHRAHHRVTKASNQPGGLWSSGPSTSACPTFSVLMQFRCHRQPLCPDLGGGGPVSASIVATRGSSPNPSTRTGSRSGARTSEAAYPETRSPRSSSTGHTSANRAERTARPQQDRPLTAADLVGITRPLIACRGPDSWTRPPRHGARRRAGPLCCPCR
jgi:hypothetical protein